MRNKPTKRAETGIEPGSRDPESNALDHSAVVATQIDLENYIPSKSDFLIDLRLIRKPPSLKGDNDGGASSFRSENQKNRKNMKRVTTAGTRTQVPYLTVDRSLTMTPSALLTLIGGSHDHLSKFTKISVFVNKRTGRGQIAC